MVVKSEAAVNDGDHLFFVGLTWHDVVHATTSETPTRILAGGLWFASISQQGICAETRTFRGIHREDDDRIGLGRSETVRVRTY